MQDLIGQSLGRYHIIEKLGEGGMAVVYKAFDTHLECDVAVKVIRLDNLPRNAEERTMKRFEREAKEVAKLNHPNIVDVKDYGEHEGIPYLVMPYLHGGTLKQLLGQPMNYQKAASLLEPIARALDYAHQHKMIHRDVKPSNILITDSGEVMLTDFGIVKILDMEEGNTLTGTGMGLGTPEYMAPEQWVGKFSPAVDQYSLGIVFYELVTGRKPYSADTPAAVLLKQATEALPRPRQFSPDLPQEAEGVIFKSLAKKPEDRYQSMNKFANALRKLERADTDREPISTPANISTPEPDTYSTVDQIEPNRAPFTPSRQEASERQPTQVEKKPIQLSGKVIGFGLGGLAVLIVIIGLASGWFSPKVSAPTASPMLTEAAATEAPATEAPFEIGSTMISEKDSMTLVYVPAGDFQMGSSDGVGDEAEHPLHQVYLDAYWIDQTEVTNGMYSMFVNETGYITEVEKKGDSDIYLNNGWQSVSGADWQHPHGPESSLNGLENHPVVHVTWNDANAYCMWAGRRLPTEAEWEKAARGIWGGTYPWGQDLPSGDLVNFADANTNFDQSDPTTNDGYSETAPVGSYPQGASPFGVYDMAGNVFEWVADWYATDNYQVYSNPQGPSTGEFKIWRGGSWNSGSNPLRSAYRAWNNSAPESNILGFRCALSGN